MLQDGSEDMAKKPFQKVGAKAGNQSKTNGKSMSKAGNKPKSNVPSNWYIMSKDEIGVDAIFAAVKDLGYHTEIWIDAAVLEVEVGEKSSMDIEQVDLDLRDEYSNAFLAERNIKSLFFVTAKPDSYDVVKKVFEVIAKATNSMVCGDTLDFEPMIQ